jgi:hypothetical protein
LFEDTFRVCDSMYRGILFSHKKNEILSFVTTWMEQEIIVLIEISQAQKTHVVLTA